MVNFPSDGKFLFNFTFLTFYWAYKVRFKGTVPPESLPEIEICLHVRVDRALGEPSPSTGLMIGPLIMTCCDQQLDFFFFSLFKGRVEMPKKFCCDTAKLLATHTHSLRQV